MPVSLKGHLNDWGAVYVALGFVLYGVAFKRWFVVIGASLVLVLVFVLALYLVVRARAETGVDPAILSTPHVQEHRLPFVCASLSAIGLDAQSAEEAAGGVLTELDLVRNMVEVPLDCKISSASKVLEELNLVSGGIAASNTSAINAASAVFPEPEFLLSLNSGIDAAVGQFFYSPEDDFLRVIFLAPAQRQALAARGWQFQIGFKRKSHAA